MLHKQIETVIMGEAPETDKTFMMVETTETDKNSHHCIKAYKNRQKTVILRAAGKEKRE